MLYKANIKTAVSIYLMFCIFYSCSNNLLSSEKPIHPKVFKMVECRLSDTVSPVVTEISLNAVEADGNQFDYDTLTAEGEWITSQCKDGGFLRYKIISNDDEKYRVLFQNNGGGSLTTCSEIEFVITTRQILVNTKETCIKVLRISSIKKSQ